MELLGPAPGDLANFGERFGAAAFESMRGAEFAGERQSAGKPIDGDDRIAACDPATTPRMESVSSVSAAQGPKVRRLSAGGSWIRTCMELFLSSRVFGLLAVLCSKRESRSSSRRLQLGSRSARKGSRDRNASRA